MSEQTTVFYKLKLKRTRTPTEVFEKIKRSVKKKGATKKWTYFIDAENQFMSVDFGDEKSETFRLSFDDKKICSGFCKVFFPLSGELFDDEKKSEFKAFINMIYAARNSFAEMEITDDYGVSESFLDTKVNKIVFRELTEDERERAKRLFDNGHTNIKEFITALLYDYRDMPYSEDFIPYINKRVSAAALGFWGSKSYVEDFFPSFVESFLYETTEYKDKGRLNNVRDYYGDLNGVWFSVIAFLNGIETITKYHVYEKGADPKSTQVLRLYYGKCLPLMEAEKSELEKCFFAYRFFVSIMDYLGFKYVGKGGKYNDLISQGLVNGVRAMLNDRDYIALRDALAEELLRKA